MGLVINIILLGIAFITFAIAGGFLTSSATRITDIPEYQAQNPDLVAAHRWASIGAIVTWITIALMLIGIILYIVFALETAAFTSKFFIYALLFLSLIGTIVVGILAALTANDINKSNVTNNNLSYRQAIIAAVLGIVVFVLLVILLILTFVHKKKIDGKAKGFGLNWLSENPELLEDL